MFNPGRLKVLDRYTEPQNITPGGARFNYGMTGGNGRALPAVGDYPSGAPVAGSGLAGYLADDAAPSSAVVWIGSLASIAALFWLAYMGDSRAR